MTFRRTFALTLVLASGLAAADINIVYVGPALQSSASGRGALQGLAEARLQGGFLGLRYTLAEAEPTDLAALRGADAILASGTAARISSLAASVREQNVPVFNVSATQDGLRAACAPNLLHTMPSDAMLAAAVAQWKQTSDATAVSARAWHEDFLKFAARDLNKRFTESWDLNMDDAAWAAWAAVRIIADAAANLPEGDRAARLAYIRDEMEFDGQKGAHMTFHKTGQLLQPLLIVENGELAGEAPVRGVAESDDLESLAPLACAAGAE